MSISSSDHCGLICNQRCRSGSRSAVHQSVYYIVGRIHSLPVLRSSYYKCVHSPFWSRRRIFVDRARQVKGDAIGFGSMVSEISQISWALIADSLRGSTDLERLQTKPDLLLQVVDVIKAQATSSISAHVGPLPSFFETWRASCSSRFSRASKRRKRLLVQHMPPCPPVGMSYLTHIVLLSWTSHLTESAGNVVFRSAPADWQTFFRCRPFHHHLQEKRPSYRDTCCLLHIMVTIHRQSFFRSPYQLFDL